MKTKKCLLLIDDTAESLKDTWLNLESYEYDLQTEDKPEKALTAISDKDPDVILLDLHFPGDDILPQGSMTTGEKLFSEIRIQFPDLPIVVFSEQLEKDKFALQGIGAAPYRYSKDQITRMTAEKKDWAKDLAETLDKAIADMEVIKPEEYEKTLGFVVGRTGKMLGVARQIIQSAPTPGTVFIEGETGTGKELVAKALHKLSERTGRFLSLNCSGMHEGTLESTLFGHEKGAFSGANERFIGAFESCDHGTLFLDEIQEMSSDLQNKLKRVLDYKTIRRMKGDGDIHVDTRIISATNRPPATLIAEGKLKDDIYYRLAKLKISLPPLRERFDDLEDLCRYLLVSICKELNRQPVVLRSDIYEKLKKYSWPGNIRDLKNVLYASVVACGSNILFSTDIKLSDDNHVLGIIPSNTLKTSGLADGVYEKVKHTETRDIDRSMLKSYMEKVKLKPVGERYDIVKMIPKDIRKDFLNAISEDLQQQKNKKLTHKDIAEYLCGNSDKNTCAKVRRFLSDNQFYLKK